MVRVNVIVMVTVRVITPEILSRILNANPPN